MTAPAAQEIKQTQIDLLLNALDVTYGKPLERWGPSAVMVLLLGYEVLKVTNVALPVWVDAIATLLTFAGGWFSRHSAG